MADDTSWFLGDSQTLTLNDHNNLHNLWYYWQSPHSETVKQSTYFFMNGDHQNLTDRNHRVLPTDAHTKINSFTKEKLDRFRSASDGSQLLKIGTVFVRTHKIFGDVCRRSESAALLPRAGVQKIDSPVARRSGIS